MTSVRLAVPAARSAAGRYWQPTKGSPGDHGYALGWLTRRGVTGSVACVTISRTASLTGDADGALARAVIDAAAGDATAAETELYRRFAPRVRLYGLRHLGDRGAADDLAQQVMLLVFQRLRAGEVRDPDRIASFILGTSRMMSKGFRRTERRREDLHVRFDMGEPEAPRTDTWTIDAVRIAPCLRAIRDRERTILILTFYGDKSAIEIGEALGMTPGAVRVGRHRALASMRDCIETRRPS